MARRYRDAAKAADPAAGKSVFSWSCSICHSVQPGKNMVGPSLFGVVGRKSGSVPGFRYSPANQSANITWDQAILEQVPAISPFGDPRHDHDLCGLKDDTKRADLIAYLATLK